MVLLLDGLHGDLQHLAVGVQDPLFGPYQLLHHTAVLEADHHPWVFACEKDTINLSKLLEKLLDDDDLIPAEGKVGGLDQDLIWHWIRAKVVESMEGVNLAIRDGQNLVEDILGIFGRLERNKPKVVCRSPEDETNSSILREGVFDCLHVE